MTSLLLVDDHPLFLDGVRAALAGEDDIEVVGEAHDAATAVAMAGDRVERRVMGRQQDARLLRGERLDECLRLDGRVRGGNGPCVARAKTKRAGSMVDREHGDPGAPERADRRQPVHPGDV